LSGSEDLHSLLTASFVLVGAGMVIGVLGHLTGSKTIVVTGITLVFAAVLFVPLAVYLSGRG
jgi:hypothetical protein